MGRQASGRRTSVGRRIRAVVLGLVGGLIGLGVAGAPVVLFTMYLVSFIATATPDSGFNVFTMGALAFIVLGAVLGVVSLVLLFFRATRPLGIGYLAGVGLVVIATLIGANLESLWNLS
jgi:uncharacterized membrane protein YhhN